MGAAFCKSFVLCSVGLELSPSLIFGDMASTCREKANASFFSALLCIKNQVLRKQEHCVVEEISLSDVEKMTDP